MTIGTVTCPQWDPCPLSGLWPHLGDWGSPVFHRRGKMQMMDILKAPIWLHHIYVGSAILFNRLKHSESGWVGTHAFIFMMAVSDALLGTREVLLDPPTSPQLSKERSTSILNDLPRITILCLFKKYMGKMNSCRLFRYWSHIPTTKYVHTEQFERKWIVCIHKGHLPERAMVTHMVTFKSPDHAVNIQS